MKALGALFSLGAPKPNVGALFRLGALFSLGAPAPNVGAPARRIYKKAL